MNSTITREDTASPGRGVVTCGLQARAMIVSGLREALEGAIHGARKDVARSKLTHCPIRLVLLR
jgi:hypothetical protein